MRVKLLGEAPACAYFDYEAFCRVPSAPSIQFVPLLFDRRAAEKSMPTARNRPNPVL